MRNSKELWEESRPADAQANQLKKKFSPRLANRQQCLERESLSPRRVDKLRM